MNRIQTRVTDGSRFPTRERLLQRSQEKSNTLDRVAVGNRASKSLPAHCLDHKPENPINRKMANKNRFPTLERGLQRSHEKSNTLDGVAVGNRASKSLPAHCPDHKPIQGQTANKSRFPTLEMGLQSSKEKGFILDGVTVGSRASKTLRAQCSDQKPIQRQMDNKSRFPTLERGLQSSKEKSFILDGMAVGSRAPGTGLPRLWGAIPPYNAQSDKHAQGYFLSSTVQGLLRKTGEDNGGTSAAGSRVDRHHTCGPEQSYLNYRNRNGAGHSVNLFGGHSRFLLDAKPFDGYNGQFGYRRNVPTLRQKSSVFGEVTPYPLH